VLGYCRGPLVATFFFFFPFSFFGGRGPFRRGTFKSIASPTFSASARFFPFLFSKDPFFERLSALFVAAGSSPPSLLAPSLCATSPAVGPFSPVMLHGARLLRDSSRALRIVTTSEVLLQR